MYYTMKKVNHKKEKKLYTKPKITEIKKIERLLLGASPG